MPQYDETFLVDCENRRSACSYDIGKNRNGNNTMFSNKRNGRRTKKFFLSNRNTTSSPSLTAIVSPISPPLPMGIYRSLCSLITKTTFNCKFYIYRSIEIPQLHRLQCTFYASMHLSLQ